MHAWTDIIFRIGVAPNDAWGVGSSHVCWRRDILSVPRSNLMAASAGPGADLRRRVSRDATCQHRLRLSPSSGDSRLKGEGYGHEDPVDQRGRLSGAIRRTAP